MDKDKKKKEKPLIVSASNKFMKDMKTIKEGTEKKKKMLEDIDKEMGW